MWYGEQQHRSGRGTECTAKQKLLKCVTQFENSLVWYMIIKMSYQVWVIIYDITEQWTMSYSSLDCSSSSALSLSSFSVTPTLSMSSFTTATKFLLSSLHSYLSSSLTASEHLLLLLLLLHLSQTFLVIHILDLAKLLQCLSWRTTPHLFRLGTSTRGTPPWWLS